MTLYPLRRSDRAITRDETLTVLDEAPFITVATVDEDGFPYAVPLSFVRKNDTLYVHAASEGGHKLDNFRRDNRVCATAVIGVEAFFADDDFSTSYQSAVVFGSMREVTTVSEFKHALVSLCMKYVPAAKHGIGKAMELSSARTAVWAIDMDNLTGKAQPSSMQKKD